MQQRITAPSCPELTECLEVFWMRRLEALKETLEENGPSGLGAHDLPRSEIADHHSTMERTGMQNLVGQRVVVIGGSGAVGEQIVKVARREGASVLAVARDDNKLQRLAQIAPGVATLPLDAREDKSPAEVFGKVLPDVLVIAAGLIPVMNPVQKQTWSDFTSNWESDVRITFHFCKEALERPLPPGSSVIIVASGAAVAGSPNTGGYAASKRGQMFIASYSQKESERLGLGIRFVTLAPRMMPDTHLGRSAVEGYAKFFGISEADYIRKSPSPASPKDVADAFLALRVHPADWKGDAFVVSGKGLEAIP
jgi:NAD(P)-dependent dehydrogenase (short-subunit alcohol dehydrogenase family)